MSTVSSISSASSVYTGGSSPTGGAGSATGTTEVSNDQFLNLLVSQLKNQNPLEPLSNEQFIGQVAQFQSLQSQQTMNSNIETLINLQAASATISHLTEASSLLGKKIEFEDPTTGESKSGTVTSVGLENGAVVAKVGETAVPILLITAVKPQE